MTVNESLKALGRWGFKLSADTPRHILDQLDKFGHIAISTGRSDCRVAGDSLLRSARYVGVVRTAQLADDGSGATSTLSGSGMAFWLGDEDKKGSVIENATPFASGSFTSTVRALLPSSGAVTEGVLHSVTGAYTQTHQWEDPRTAISYVCDTFTSDSQDPVEWRVNGDATLDAGKASQLYVTDPACAIVRRGAGVDMKLRALRGKTQLTSDVEDFTTRVVLLATGRGRSVATGSADILPGLNVYKDLYGNPIKMTRLVSESATSQGNAASRAQLQLNQFTSPRNAVNLSTDEYDIKGTAQVGDSLWVWNPDVGLVDENNEVTFRGMRFHPVKLRLIEMTWPISPGMSVAYRDKLGNWLDLTDYVQHETGNTTLVVGGYDRSLTNSGSEPIGSRPIADTSIPAAPAFLLPFRQSVYQSSITGITKAQVEVAWAKPANTDGTLVIDGDRYEIQYRTGSVPIFPATHTQMSAYTHDQLAAGTHAQPITYTAGPWQSAYTTFDDTAHLLQELTPGVPYDVRIRAFDNATPANVSEWSATTTIQTVGDTIAPSTPAPPSVAASRIAVQVTHLLGRSDGGTYNLEADLNHLEIHAQYEPLFTPSDSTRIGKLLANNGMMIGEIPAVGTFPVESTDDVYIKVIAVDDAGNKSSPSTATQSTVLLIDDAHISDLTVSKVTAGTITATWVLAGSIKTANTGARMEADAAGLRLYNAGNANTVNLNASTGDATITGKLQTGATGQRVIIDPSNNGFARILMYDDTTTNYVAQEVFGGNFQIQARRVSDSTPNGGRLLFDLASDGSGSAYLAFRNASSTWHYQVGSDGGHHLKGFFARVATQGGLGALHVDQAGGSGTSMSYSYGATYATTPLPFVEIQGTSGSPPTASSHAVTARSQTGFSIQYPAGNCDVFIWAVRYG